MINTGILRGIQRRNQMDDMYGQAGKGDTYRPVDQAKWEENYERIFGSKKSNQDPHDFRQKYRTGQTIRITTDLDPPDKVITAKISKVTAFCVHCKTADSTMYRIARNVDGRPWIADTCEDCEIQIVE